MPKDNETVEYADSLIQTANRTLLTTWFSFKSMEIRLYEAEERYSAAARIYKKLKAYDKSASAFKKLSNVYKAQGELWNSENAAIEAAKTYQNIPSRIREAISCYNLATEIAVDRNDYVKAAKLASMVGELCEADADGDGAVKGYELAVEYHSTVHNYPSDLVKYKMKLAKLYALREDYRKAIDLFDSVAIYMTDSSRVIFSADDAFFYAILCQFCLGDEVATKRYMERSCNYNISFSSSSKYKFLTGILQALEDLDVSAFTETMHEHERLLADNWNVTMLTRIKALLEKNMRDNVL
jgi:tetratricopeptide (TPR) repeat protein